MANRHYLLNSSNSSRKVCICSAASDTPIITPEDRDTILEEIFELIGSESTKIQGLEQLAFYIKEFKREIGSDNDFYLQRQHEVLNRMQRAPQNAMAKNISKYATDLEEIVQHCAWYLYDPICINQPNIDILHFFIRGLSVDQQTVYDKSMLRIRIILLQRMWKLVFFDNLLPFSIQEQLTDADPDFLVKILTNLLEKICDSDFDESDLMLVKIDLNYQKILRLCQLYRNAFKVAYTTIAEKMLKTNTTTVRSFLKTFLIDVKSAMKISEFSHHYEDELINYVLIFSECRVGDENIIRHFSNKLKESNYLQYFILDTHFPNLLLSLD